jgi:acetolactate decarboxylase
MKYTAKKYTAKDTVTGTALALLVAACATTDTPTSAAWRGDVERWGTLREALRDGQDQARVSVDEVARKGVYAVGALEDLRGEVTVFDGEVWISEGRGKSATTTRGQAAAQATVLFAAEVGEWREVAVETDVDPSELDAWIARQAEAAGLDTTRPFPFVVQGGLRRLHMHVVAGECPIRARMLGRETTPPAYELHAETIEGRLVGFFAANASGILCHANSRTHVHALLEKDGGLTGHAESVGLAAGAVLLLPAE